MFDIVKMNKVKVFISSNCDSVDDKSKGHTKYSVMRKSLKLLLDMTEMCEVYAFEEGTSTSCDVVSSFMYFLDDSDLVIVIVDNKDGIGDGTQKEINRMKALEKKCIYFFCDEREKEATELEKEIRKSISNPRYTTVHEFADIPKKVYESVINDILFIYTSYCRGRIGRTDIEKQMAENNSDEFKLPIAEDSDIPKDFISQFNYTKYIVKKEAGVAFGEVKPMSDNDKRCADLLGTIIGSAYTDTPDFDSIKKDIMLIHKGNVQRLVGIRYEAIEAYFSGKLSKCIAKLEEAIDFINKCKNIPKWMLNDVALDLRNIQIEINNSKGIIKFDSLGQSILDDDNEPLYYPVIDRIVSNYNEAIIKSGFNHSTQSPYTVGIGGVDTMMERAGDAFIVAYYYGSITHMLLIRRRISAYITGLALEIRDHRVFMLAVRLLLLSNEDKDLKQFLNTYGENTNNINATDAESLLLALNKQPIKMKRIMARESAMRFFGYYYTDDIFRKESNELIETVKKSLKNGNWGRRFVKPLLDAMKDTSYRFLEKEVLEFVLFMFEKKQRYYYDDIFNFLYTFRFTSLSKKEQKTYQNFIIEALNDNDTREKNKNIYQAAQTLRQCETINHAPLDNAVKKYDTLFFENTYLLNVEQHDKKTGWMYTERFVEEIENDNKTQGKGGVYTKRAYNPYLTIHNILVNDKLILNTKQLRRIVDAIQGALFSKTQTLESKIGAVELLCIIQMHQPSNHQIEKIYNDITNRREDITDAKDRFLIRGYSKTNLNLIICMLGTILKYVDGSELGMRLVDIQNSDISEQLTVLSFLERIYRFDLSKYSSSAYDLLFQYLLNASYNQNPDVRFRAMSVLSKIKEKKYRDICLERFVSIMDYEDYKVKVGLLYRLQKEDFDDPKVKYIIDKGKMDTHYWVRFAANRFENS